MLRWFPMYMPLFCHVTTFFRGFKTFFRPFEPQFGLKIRGSCPLPPPQSLPLDPPLTYDPEVNPRGLETIENVVRRGQGSTREPDTKREVLSSSGLNDTRFEALWLHNKERKKEKKSLLEYYRSLRAEEKVLYRIKQSQKTVSLVMLSIHFFIYRARKL